MYIYNIYNSNKIIAQITRPGSRHKVLYIDKIDRIVLVAKRMLIVLTPFPSVRSINLNI